MTDFLGRLGISIPRYRRAKVSLNLDRTHRQGQGIMQCWLYYATSNDARESFLCHAALAKGAFHLPAEVTEPPPHHVAVRLGPNEVGDVLIHHVA